MQMCSRVTGVLCLANSIVGKQNVCRPILRLTIGKYVQGADSDIRSRKMSGQGPGQGIPDGHKFDNEEMKQFLQQMHDLIVEEALDKGTNRETKVVNFEHPAELQSKLDLAVGEKVTDTDKLLELSKSVIHYSVKTGSTRFYNQLYSGLNGYGVAGAWLTEALNTNLHTFEVSPVFVLMEQTIIKKLCNIIGFSKGDGVFCPGGSFANIMSVNIARYKACPDIKKTGLFGLKRLKIYISAEAHYSFAKAASFLGLGSESVVAVDTDEKGIMKAGVLEELIKQDKEKGEMPLMVATTAGTTVLGAYDDLTTISDVCQRHGIWHHCDACWGGGVLFSKKHRHLMASIERCDSVSWNLHKMNAAPLQTSALLVKEKGLLEQCHQYKADYLFQPDKFYDTSYDIGDKTVQCGRKVDVLKLWLMWKAEGDEGMEQAVDKAFDNARYLEELLQKTEGFRLVIPQALRNQEETDEWREKLSKVAPQIKEKMVKNGSLLIGYTPLKLRGYVNFFRIIIENKLCEHSDMDYVVQEIERLGKDVVV